MIPLLPVLALFALMVTVFTAPLNAAPFCASGQDPEFLFGFAHLKSLLGDSMGEPVECEHANPQNEDALQQTTTGLAFYRNATNTPTFTDGWNHWAWTADGLDYWTGSSIDPPIASDSHLPSGSPTHTPTSSTSSSPPSNLALPLDLEDVVYDAGEFLSPFGLVRKSVDRSDLGHGGIDVPLVGQAPIYAVADGTIISVEPSVDFRPGQVVVLLIEAGDRQGEGWVFLYEHITLEPGIGLGDAVTTGQLIARNAMATGMSNNHLELNFSFNDHRFYRDKTCWVDYLQDELKRAFVDLFENDIRVSSQFVEGWRQATDENMYPYQRLLDSGLFPDGPQMCYPPGTDVRIPAS